MAKIKEIWGHLVGYDAGRYWASYLCLLSLAPAILGSLLFPSFLVPGAVGLSALCAYYAFKGVQAELFKLDSKASYLYLNLPLYLLCLGWAAAVIGLGKVELVARCVGPAFLLTAVCIWPVYRFKTDRQERRVPFENVYPVYAGLIGLQQALILWKEIVG